MKCGRWEVEQAESKAVAPQVFTRDQVIDLLAQYPADPEYKIDYQKLFASNREIASEYMDTNYPAK